MPVKTIDLIRRGTRQFGDRTAVLFGDQRLSFLQVDELSNRFAHVFSDHGMERGSKIALLVGNDLYSIPLDFACVKAGVARVPLNARLSSDEHERMLAETGAGVLVYVSEFSERAAELASRLPGLQTLGLGSSEVGGDLLQEADSVPDTDPELPAEPSDIILILYTSGTTGTLKAAQHTQASYAAICTNILTNLIDVERDDVMLHAASLIHASGTFVLPFWIRGATSAILTGFDPDEYLAAIPRWRVTAVNMVPTMLQMLLATPGVEETDTSSLRHVIYGASPMPQPVLQRGLELWGKKFVQYYGQTEAPLCMTVLPKEDHDFAGTLSCGQPVVEAELKLVD